VLLCARAVVFTSVRDGDVLFVLGHGVLYNHSPNPNVEYVQDEPTTITFRALRKVRPGDELTIDDGRAAGFRLVQVYAAAWARLRAWS
jgi:SET domain-containing protein